MAHVEEMRNKYEKSENVKGRNQLGDLGIDGKIKVKVKVIPVL
jgi:hypothetical protein